MRSDVFSGDEGEEELKPMDLTVPLGTKYKEPCAFEEQPWLCLTFPDGTTMLEASHGNIGALLKAEGVADCHCVPRFGCHCHPTE